MRRLARIIAAITLGSVCTVSSCMRDFRAIVSPEPVSLCDEAIQVGGFTLCMWEDE